MSDSRAGAFRTVVDMWRLRVSSTPSTVSMLSRRGRHWTEHTWQQVDRRVQSIAGGLLSCGIALEERVAILATTSVPWILADIGILCAGAATTTVYTTSSADEIRHILSDSGARFVFCDDDRRAASVLALRDELPALEGIFVFDGKRSDDGFVRPLDELERVGRTWLEANPNGLEEVRSSLTSDNLATLIYTSGTTGQPKGVELTHGAWVYTGEAIDRLRLISPDDRQLLFLPLAHVFAKVMEILFIRIGVPTAVEGNPDRVLDSLSETRATWFAGVPRVFEKARNRILGDIHDRGFLQRLAFRHGIERAMEVRGADRSGHPAKLRKRVQYALADRLMFAQIRARFGGRLRFMVSGGAPLSTEVASFFDALGIVVCEGYGLTETAAASTVNTPDDLRLATVGRPLPGCEVRIASDGEVLLRSPGVMRGYHNLPEDTAAVLTEDGWLHTGDIGVLEPTGHLRITDRKKDLIVTAGGKNVAPALFQERLKARAPYISHVLVHGDRRNFCSALVTLDEEAIVAWAREEGLPVTDLGKLAARPEVRELVSQAIEDVNRTVSAHEQVRRFAVLSEDFTTGNGLLTPSMKMKRRPIEARYQSVLDGFYEGVVRTL
jgi:long-chain acyl-CoA synthetase